MATVEERLREWIDRETGEFEAKGPDHLRGDAWWQVSLEEQAVFGLRPETMARVLVVFDAYEAIAYGVDDMRLGTPLCEAARREFPWIEQGERGSQADLDTFQRFARMFGVSSRQSFAFYWKHAFHDVRSGVMRFGDETDEEREKALAEAVELPDDHPRLRGLYPEFEPVDYESPQVPVTVSLDADQYDWLKGISLPGSPTYCVEQIIRIALSAMRGKDMHLDRLVDIVAGARRTTAIDALFGNQGAGGDDAGLQAAAHLYQAAKLAAWRHFGPGFFEDALPAEQDREAVLALLRTVLPDWDPVKEVEEMWAARNAETGKWVDEHREQWDAEVTEEDEKAARRDQEKRREGDFDDGIPF